MLLAVGHAITILGWYEHLTEDDMPPIWMWHLDWELERHFEKVKERRKNGRDSDDEDREMGPMIHNEYARGRGRELAAVNV